MSINTESVKNLETEVAPLFHQYPGQINPQPAYLEMDEDGNVCADYSGEIGNGVPSYVWHSRTLRWSLPATLTGVSIAEFVSRKDVAELLERVHAGQSIEWDGSNHVGRFTEDANSASEDLEALLYSNPFGDSDHAWVMTSREWAFSSQTIAEVWPEANETLDELEKRVKGDTIHADSRIVLTTEMRSAILDEINDAYDAERDYLMPHHLAALVADGRIRKDEADDFLAERI